MSARSGVDRESFQQFLASAFAVQESQIDSRFLTAFLAVQGLVAGGDLDIDGVMNRVVDSTRDVAGAAGVAIGLLERDQLVYRAGSGCAASWIGVRFAASLTISAKIKDSREILRVENARTDTRIEGAICRQFGAESLLILPIYRDRILAGVMEILFSEPHDYLDCEVRMYRLMAGLIEEAMCRAVQPKRLLPAELPAVRNAVEETPTSTDSFAGKQPILSLYAIGQDISRRCGAALAAARQLPALQRPRLLPEGMVQRATEGLRAVGKNTLRRSGAALAAARQSPAFRRPGLLAEIMVQRATEVLANKPLRSLALSAVAIGLGLTFWMAHGGRGLPSRWESPAPSKSTDVRSFQPEVKPVDVTSKRRHEPIPAKEMSHAKLRNRRARVGQAEVDYIGDDVTVRHFTTTPPRQRTAGQVAYIGEDVTVRHFTPKPVVRSQSQ